MSSIYKYISLDGAVSVLSNNYVALNNPQNYNDPFDCKVDNIDDVALKIKVELDKLLLSIHPSSITILFDRKDTREKLVSDLKSLGYKINEYQIDSSRKTLTYYTLQGFKGLENDCIIYVRTLSSFKNDYVAISRAHGICYVYTIK